MTAATDTTRHDWRALRPLADRGVLGARAVMEGRGSRLRMRGAHTTRNIPDWFVGLVEWPNGVVQFWTWEDGRRSMVGLAGPRGQRNRTHGYSLFSERGRESMLRKAAIQ